MLLKLYIFLVRCLEFTVDRKLQLELCQNDFLGVDTVVHKGVQLSLVFNPESAEILSHIKNKSS